jgi:hypothetical protein
MVPGRMPGMVPRTKCRSVPQIALVVIRTIASSCRSIRGSGTSSTEIFPTSCHMTAFICQSSPV